MGVRFDAVMLTVRDMERSVAFYRDRLGLEPVTISPGWSEFKLSETFHLGLHLTDMGLPMPQNLGMSFGLVLYSNNLNAEVQQLKARGLEFTIERQEEDNIWLAEFKDPDGYSLQIFELKPRGPR